MKSIINIVVVLGLASVAGLGLGSGVKSIFSTPTAFEYIDTIQIESQGKDFVIQSYKDNYLEGETAYYIATMCEGKPRDAGMSTGVISSTMKCGDETIDLKQVIADAGMPV